MRVNQSVHLVFEGAPPPVTLPDGDHYGAAADKITARVGGVSLFGTPEAAVLHLRTIATAIEEHYGLAVADVPDALVRDVAS